MPDGDQSLMVKLHSSIADISSDAWDTCAGQDNPFVSHAFLSALEASGSVGKSSGWIPQYMSVRSAGDVISAVAPMYAKLHSYGEYVFDHAWAEAFERTGGHYYPKLQICVPFSPVPGPRLLRSPVRPMVVNDLSDALKSISAQMKISSVHTTFCTEDEWMQLGQAGWLQRLGMQFHWYNKDYRSFDDFLGALSSRHRKSIRRERRDANAAGLRFETLRGSDIKARHWDAFYQFYRATVDRKWGEAYLTRDFFEQLSERMADKVVLMMATHDSTLIAGALNLLGSDTLYGRNWGSVGSWPFLHFELCYYRAIEFAIEHGLKRVEAGAQGEHKILRGYLPQLTYSVHYIAHKGLARAVGDFLDHEREAIKHDIESLSTLSPYRQDR